VVIGPASKVGNHGSNPRDAVLARILRADIGQTYRRENLIPTLL